MHKPFTERPIGRVDEHGKKIGRWKLRYSEAELLEMHRDMVRARELDRKLVTLLKQGKTSFYAQADGMEATQIGIGKAMRSGHDWFWGYYRDQGVALALGMETETIVAQSMGTLNDRCKGRQMPHHLGDSRFNLAAASSSIASQVPPAAGTAMAQKYLGTDEVTFCTFGDGATSEGDWHAGLNMASVAHAPALFICENNQWAISVPVQAQTRSEHIHLKAHAYGIPGYFVDGNDVLAVREVLEDLAEMARNGEGPFLIECLTYRVGSHSNADADAEKSYRTREEVERWTSKDPLRRFETFLRGEGLDLSEERVAEMAAEARREVDDAIKACDASGVPGVDEMFVDVYSDVPWHLQEQWDSLKEEQA